MAFLNKLRLAMETGHSPWSFKIVGALKYKIEKLQIISQNYYSTLGQKFDAQKFFTHKVYDNSL